MSLVKICELDNAPGEGQGLAIHLIHPFTEFPYELALFHAEGTYYALTIKCSKCGVALATESLNGLFVKCRNDMCLWHVKKGFCKFDRTSILPTYKVLPEPDGLYINI
jgi:nitrite reductase/ring-hydroxylating ferredoxin subunit